MFLFLFYGFRLKNILCRNGFLLHVSIQHVVYSIIMTSFGSESCNLFELSQNALLSEGNSQAKQCALLFLAVVAITFVTSSLTRNYSQVDKIWSITPFLYAWIFVCDARTLIMALVTTIWGLRLTWNFNRRGGYKWPPWDGDEDYRWKYIQDGLFVDILRNKVVWVLFNFGFISLYQNLLLLLIATPSVIANLVATKCGESPLNIYDYLGAFFFLGFVVIESIADNQQYAFQTEKYRLREFGKPLESDYADGFNQSGLFSIVRKPNYAAEQAIWISFYLFSVASVQGEQLVNWSMSGFVLLCLLFQGSGAFTEKITLTKYPKYKNYMDSTPLYVPNPFRRIKAKGKQS